MIVLVQIYLLAYKVKKEKIMQILFCVLCTGILTRSGVKPPIKKYDLNSKNNSLPKYACKFFDL